MNVVILHHSILSLSFIFHSWKALKQKAEDLTREKEEAEKKAEDLRLKYKQLDQNSELMKNQLRLYSGKNDHVDSFVPVEFTLVGDPPILRIYAYIFVIYCYIGEDGVDLESLERALTLVKKRGEALASLPFKGDDKDEEMVMLPYVKRKLSEVQIMNLKLTEEVERYENIRSL